LKSEFAAYQLAALMRSYYHKLKKTVSTTETVFFYAENSVIYLFRSIKTHHKLLV